MQFAPIEVSISIVLCVHDRADTSPFVDDPSWEPGKGTCKTEGVSINRGEPLVACEDHLDPPCEDVVNVSIPPDLRC